MNLLIDVNVVIDICTQRKPRAEPSAIALEIAKINHVVYGFTLDRRKCWCTTLYRQLRQENLEAERGLTNAVALANANFVDLKTQHDLHPRRA